MSRVLSMSKRCREQTTLHRSATMLWRSMPGRPQMKMHGQPVSQDVSPTLTMRTTADVLVTWRPSLAVNFQTNRLLRYCRILRRSAFYGHRKWVTRAVRRHKMSVRHSVLTSTQQDSGRLYVHNYVHWNHSQVVNVESKSLLTFGFQLESFSSTQN